MSRSKDETRDGYPILFDECSDTIKYYLLGSDDPNRVTIKAYGTNERGVEYGGTVIHVPAGVLVRMADQLRTSASTDGVNPEVLLSATNDQVVEFLRDRIGAMHRLLSDDVMLPAMIAALITVLPEGMDEDNVDAEEIRELVECGGYTEVVDAEECDEEFAEKCTDDDYDIEVDTECDAFITLRYCIRVAYEVIRTNQIRENKRSKRG